MKRVLRYLKGTKSRGLFYRTDIHVDSSYVNSLIYGFSDSDWAQEEPQRKFMSGCVSMMASGDIS